MRRWLRVSARGTLALGELTEFLHTARAGEELRMWPMIVDANDATTDMGDDDADKAAALVAQVVTTTGPRAHVAIATTDDRLFRWMLRYETQCAQRGVRIIRVFRHTGDAERWLEIVSAARNLH